MLIQAQVNGPPSSSLIDGAQPAQLAGKAGELIYAELHGKYYTQAYRGNVFVGSTAAAGVIPAAYNATAQKFGIWNPIGSGKNIVLIKAQVGLVTVGVVTSSWCWSYVLTAGAQVATGNTISAATLGTPVNTNLGSKNTSIANFAPATITTTAPLYLKPIGVTNFMASTPTAQNSFWQLTEYYDGDLIITPGTAVFMANNIAGVATWAISVLWEEVAI